MGSGSFIWRALAVQTASESVKGLGESPYFPTLRGPRKKHVPGSPSGVGVTGPEHLLPVNKATADKGKGEYSAEDRAAVLLDTGGS